MRVRILEDFVTPFQRLRAGMEMLAHEIAHPLTIEQLIERGMVAPIDEAPTEAAPAGTMAPAIERVEPVELLEHDPSEPAA